MKHNVPVLLERDFNFPEIEELQKEMEVLRKISLKNIDHNVVYR